MPFINLTALDIRRLGQLNSDCRQSCKECNSSIIFDDSSDVFYLYHLTEETPLLYAKLALKANGLQDYVNAMNEFS